MTATGDARKLRPFMHANVDAKPGTAGRVRRTLRRWALADGVYGLAIALLALLAVPWKTPAINLVALVWALGIVAGAPFLWRGWRGGYWLALGTSLVGLVAAVLAVCGFVASWAYLRAAYGAFGAGASLGSLLVAGMVFEVLGLYPALRLAALLRAEIRAAMRTGRGPVALSAAIALLPVPVGVGIHGRFRLDPVEAADSGAMRAAIANVRAALAGNDAVFATNGALALGPGPIVLTLWGQGRVVARASAGGDSFAAALELAKRRLRASLADVGFSERGLIKLDRVVARGPVVRQLPLAFALGLDPGLDGLIDDEDKVIFLGDDVIAAGVAGASAPLAALTELRLGVDVGWMERKIADAKPMGAVTRIRTEGWIEVDGDVAPVYRGNVDTAALAPKAAAIAGADYLLRQAESDGRFRYRYQPFEDAALTGEVYSLARHAGVAYGFAVLYGETKAERFAEGARMALGWLAQQIPPSCGRASGRYCLVEEARAAFGPTALAAIAMFEYQRRTGDRRYEELARGLTAFLADRQLPNGDFAHGFAPALDAVIPGPARLFASEQASLALVLAHRVSGVAGYLPRAERALDFLTREKYDFWLGRFIYGADHWTCIAVDEAWPALKHRHYVDFCRGYAAFMRRLQYPPAPDRPPRDFAGHYGFGYQLVPQAPATAGFLEALLSTIALSRQHGLDVSELERDARLALSALVREQLRHENSYLAPRPDHVVGGFRRSLVEPEIRIDFVQHAASALARAEGLGLGTL